jgi:hypothetical protein
MDLMALYVACGVAVGVGGLGFVGDYYTTVLCESEGAVESNKFINWLGKVLWNQGIALATFVISVAYLFGEVMLTTYAPPAGYWLATGSGAAFAVAKWYQTYKNYQMYKGLKAAAVKPAAK